jgi:hypothetical protein
MTVQILKNIDRAELDAMHGVYVALHKSHAVSSARFTLAHCAKVLAAVMSCNPWVWRVVGVTPAALEAIRQSSFRYKSGGGITRAHLRPRVSSVKLLMQTDKPLPVDDFIESILTHDITVLCARGENKETVPAYIAFENEDASLFSSKPIGFVFGKKEAALLQQLSAQSQHTLVHPDL